MPIESRTDRLDGIGVVARGDQERNATRTLDGADVGLIVAVDDDSRTWPGQAITGDTNDWAHTYSPRNRLESKCRVLRCRTTYPASIHTDKRYDHWSLGSANGDVEETGLPVVRRESVLGLRDESRIKRQIQASQPINITRTIDPVINNAFSDDDKSRQCRLCSLPERTAEVK